MTAPETRPDSDQLIGWLFVGAQVALLVVLVVLPEAGHWPVPGWLSGLGYALMAVGLALVAAAGLRLGPGLTPTPVPNERGRLVTTGLYRFSRHPIYSGVLLIVAGLVIRSGNVMTGIVGVATAAFFTAKAHWEESKLRDRYPGYEDYAAGTGRFFPRLRRGSA